MLAALWGSKFTESHLFECLSLLSPAFSDSEVHTEPSEPEHRQRCPQGSLSFPGHQAVQVRQEVCWTGVSGLGTEIAYLAQLQAVSHGVSRINKSVNLALWGSA